MKKIISIFFTIIIVLICMYIGLHSTPYIALRTHVFMSGHPVIAVKTDIMDDKLHNRIDKEALEKENAKCYTLTKPVRTNGFILGNYKVSKRRFLYFAEYYGEA